mmetsp:Transcript_82853/g.239361  ORF Transcript_82853/g.239361 Transcript_82853/m.239361 type:complete len:202 (+) Transcript_82853:89-694(+)
MVFHILDISLLQEWLGTCQEYFPLVLKPFSKMSPKQIFSCNQSNLEDWFTVWSAIQVWWALIINIIAIVLLFVFYSDGDVVGPGVRNLVVGVITAYIWAHMGWFAVVKKQGCCCCCIVCMSQAPILLLIYGIWLILWGVLTILNALEWLDLFDEAFLYVICYGSYAIPLLYMGIAMLKIWNNKKSEPQLGDTSATVIGRQS